MTKQKTNHLIEFIIISAILLSLVVIFIGSHNIDNSWNMLSISYYEELSYDSYCDRTYSGECIDYDNLYMLGQTMVMTGAVSLTICSFALFFVNLNRLKEVE